MSSNLKKIIKKSLLLNILYRLYNEYRTYNQISKGDFCYNTGQRNANSDIQDSLNYIEKISGWYNQSVPIFDGFLKDKKVLEIGPGDSFAMALRFLQLGLSLIHI